MKFEFCLMSCLSIVGCGSAQQRTTHSSAPEVSVCTLESLSRVSTKTVEEEYCGLCQHNCLIRRDQNLEACTTRQTSCVQRCSLRSTNRNSCEQRCHLTYDACNADRLMDFDECMYSCPCPTTNPQQ